VEWGPKGIRLNAIAPGPFPTKGAWDRLIPNKEIDSFTAFHTGPFNIQKPRITPLFLL
jgi:NAD(P)-dependent dehydrogenase (short-subunit alcohol dehydrogenase family)